MQPRSLRVEIRLRLIERMMSSTSSATSLGQLLARARFARDQTPSSGLSRGKVLEVQAVMWSQKLKQGQFFHHQGELI